jgi:plastocyanin
MRSPTVLRCLAVLPGVLTGCGEDPVTAAPSGRVTVTLDEFSLEPGRIEVPPGEITITVRNAGKIHHNLRLRRDSRERPFAGVSSIAPGGSATFTATIRHSGSFRLYCSVSRHEDLGQYGTLVVAR